MTGRVSQYYPRKIRKVTTGDKTQYLLSVPHAIATAFSDDVFICVMEKGRIVFTPITEENSDAA
jgi:hypothetical protein